MVASALLAPSLHIRRIYLYGVVKQYGQAMKSKVIKCVKSPTNFFTILFLAFLHYLWWQLTSLHQSACIGCLLSAQDKQQQAVKLLLHPNGSAVTFGDEAAEESLPVRELLCLLGNMLCSWLSPVKIVCLKTWSELKYVIFSTSSLLSLSGFLSWWWECLEESFFSCH